MEYAGEGVYGSRKSTMARWTAWASVRGDWQLKNYKENNKSNKI